MIQQKKGRVVKGLGGLFEVRVEEQGKVSRLNCRAKGALKRDEQKVLIGDRVTVTVDDSTPDGVVISSVEERKNSLIRPPISNLDYIFAVFAARKPSPVLETVDKLIAIAEHNRITPVAVITKADLGAAEELAAIYSAVGIPTFVTSVESGEGLDALSAFVRDNVCDGRTAAFAGASGVGKSTLMNALFPGLTLATSGLSHRIERGRHTTRHVELFEISEGADTGFLADTPGFSLLDFSRFDFFTLEELLPTFRELLPYLGKCKYADCAHVGEGAADCAVAQAVSCGLIPESRFESYKSIYKVLKEKNRYE